MALHESRITPKRPGTAAYTKFSAFRDGMTVASYLAAPGNGGTGEIRWCLAHRYIRLEGWSAFAR
jgi:hypothetical protein